jgi:hypothetical protein
MGELRGLPFFSGCKTYRAYGGQPERYDILFVLQFRILTDLGLREFHNVLDLGCGCLRVGRLLIPFLLDNRYVRVEPESWLVDSGIKYELGETIRSIKHPQFCFDGEYSLVHFGRAFDYVMIQSVFSHAPLDWIERCAVRLSKVLAEPAGLVVANYLEGPSDCDGSEWLYPGCRTYQRNTLEGLFAAAGLGWREINHYTHPAGLTWFLLSR